MTPGGRSRSPRHLLVAAFMALVWGAQLHFVIAAYDSPHKHFGYQPFNESSTWEAQIVRVTRDGRREDIRHGWEGYRWDELVRGRGLDVPFVRHHASYGAAATLDLFQQALDWVATHTPADRSTHHFEAQVIVVRNAGEPRLHQLRSVTRPP
ncbi:MAG: hypothetical protein AAF447_11365 [Myxococcota bacterium]